MNHAVMLLSNAFRPDPRVLKEAESLAALGYRISIVCWDRLSEMEPEETLESGVHVLRVQAIHSAYGIGMRQLLHLPRFWLATLPILNRLGPDLIHCHDFDTLPLGLLWGKIHRRPVVYDAHEYYALLCKPRLHGPCGKLLYRLIDFAERVSARAASTVVTVDESLGATYRQMNKRVVIIGHYPNRHYAAETTHVFNHTSLTLIYIGRLSVDRGVLIYIDLLRRLREKGIPARLRLVGVFTSQEEEEHVRQYCQELGEALDIIYWIHYKKVFALLREADIGLVILQPEPRYVAALPVKLFEYMAAGLPVVASNFSPIASILEETRCGVTIDPLAPEAAVHHVIYWWEHPEEARFAGENGRQAILQRYNWETFTSELDHLYRSLLN